MHNYSRSLQI